MGGPDGDEAYACGLTGNQSSRNVLQNWNLTNEPHTPSSWHTSSSA